MAYYDDVEFEPDTSPGYLMRHIIQASWAKIEPDMVAAGLTMSQWLALVSMRYGRASTAAELARELAHDAGAMTRLLDQLEDRGWIERQRDAADRRRVNLSLTSTGLEVTKHCQALIGARWSQWFEGWRKDEVDGFIRALWRLRRTLDPSA